MTRNLNMGPVDMGPLVSHNHDYTVVAYREDGMNGPEPHPLVRVESQFHMHAMVHWAKDIATQMLRGTGLNARSVEAEEVASVAMDVAIGLWDRLHNAGYINTIPDAQMAGEALDKETEEKKF